MAFAWSLAERRAACRTWWVIAFASLAFFFSFLLLSNCLCLDPWVFLLCSSNFAPATLTGRLWGCLAAGWDQPTRGAHAEYQGHDLASNSGHNTSEVQFKAKCWKGHSKAWNSMLWGQAASGTCCSIQTWDQLVAPVPAPFNSWTAAHHGKLEISKGWDRGWSTGRMQAYCSEWQACQGMLWLPKCEDSHTELMGCAQAAKPPRWAASRVNETSWPAITDCIDAQI